MSRRQKQEIAHYCYHCGRAIQGEPIMGKSPEETFCGEICKKACGSLATETEGPDYHNYLRGWPNRPEDLR